MLSELAEGNSVLSDNIVNHRKADSEESVEGELGEEGLKELDDPDHGKSVPAEEIDIGVNAFWVSIVQNNVSKDVVIAVSVEHLGFAQFDDSTEGQQNELDHDWRPWEDRSLTIVENIVVLYQQFRDRVWVFEFDFARVHPLQLVSA